MRKDGSILRIAFSTAPFELPDGPGSVTAFTDVEEHLKPRRRRASATSPRARATELRAARRRIIEAADAARARLERDLHDGAQQQLVNLALRLRIARGKLPVDPERGRAAARRRDRADGHRDERAARARRGDPSGDPHAPRARPRRRSGWLRGCRCRCACSRRRRSGSRLRSRRASTSSSRRR